jgi:predicted nicotinamide N-methyase
MQMSYKLQLSQERIGPPGHEIGLTIERLANLNETIDELFAELERQGNPALLESLCPYFGVVWPSARGLAEQLAQLGAPSLAGRSILEVGCGLAVPSLLAARLGARVVATDFHPDISRFLHRNMELNGLSGAKAVGSLEFVPWDWQKQASPLGKFEWVIGSDILYERQHPEPVARMIAHHVAPGGRVILADPGRPYLQNFADEMKRLGFDCRVSARNVVDEPVRKDIFILELERELERRP